MTSDDRKKLRPWKLFSSKVAFETPWFKIYRNHMATPDGVEADYYVHHSYDVVICVCITSDNKVILEKQYRPPIKAVSYDYPAGGMMKIDHSAPDAMRRELLEELGFKAHKLEKVGSLFTNPGFSESKVHVFVAHGDIETKAKPEPTENIVELQVEPPDQILKMIDDGTISCLFCVSTTFLAFRHLGYLKTVEKPKA